MSETEENKYWADLRKLRPSTIRVSLNQEDEALNALFKKEYDQFGDPTKDPKESTHSLGRRLLYIIDRAVFIMYLRQEKHWDAAVSKLEEARIRYLKDKNPRLTKIELGNDPYIKAINVLHGVFLYQKSTRLGNLFDKLDDIATLLEPSTRNGFSSGNRMIYCLSADYLALVYHKKATLKLGEIIGQKEFYLDNNAHFVILKKKLEESKKDEVISASFKSAIQNFYQAAIMFKDVVSCQVQLQSDPHNIHKRYIWESYALYNQARCEFMIHILNSLNESIVINSVKDVADNAVIERGNFWHESLQKAVKSRYDDYTYFQDKEECPLFPQFITFNLQAEYYHAFYEYELSCMIKKQIHSAFEAQEFTGYSDFSEWKNANLTITDVLKVDEKVGRIKRLKEDHVRKVVRTLVNKLVPEPEKQAVRETLYQQLQNISPDIIAAILSADPNRQQDTKKKFLGRIKKTLSHFGIEPKMEISFGVNVLFARCQAALVLKRKNKEGGNN